MKKGRSIRFKIGIWFTLLLVLVVGLSFLVVHFTSSMVLKNVNRDFLISAVEKNAEMIRISREQDLTEDNFYLPYKEAFLEIDDDFLDEMGGVFAALYASDGTLIYGENPLARQTQSMVFQNTRLWHVESGGESYILYDRSIHPELSEGLWLRGMVSETRALEPLNTITRLSLILLPILILLAVLLIHFLTDKMLQPLKRVEETAREIAGGKKLDRRIEGIRSRDEVGQLAQTFNQMMEQLEESFERERRFTSDASHELRTPTSVILAQTEYVLEKERSAQEYKEALVVVDKQGRRMKGLISDMLDYSRLDLSSDRYAMEKTDLSSLTRETAQAMAPVGESRLSYELSVEDGIAVLGNENLLVRLIQNLISNAFRYGNPEGFIRISLDKAEGKALLAVRDNGPGIPKAEQEKIFERFYRSDASRSVQGTGLGLSLVKKIAQLHEAELELESEEGRGSCFKIFFDLLEF
ncbi:MAG: HAMP domain-containing histidine kinase [Lachnospiraceae bacterium]|nr:HAMP domain-containing histidine kinase [Lachnospiraceae bacterium]